MVLELVPKNVDVAFENAPDEIFEEWTILYYQLDFLFRYSKVSFLSFLKFYHH